MIGPHPIDLLVEAYASIAAHSGGNSEKSSMFEHNTSRSSAREHKSLFAQKAAHSERRRRFFSPHLLSLGVASTSPHETFIFTLKSIFFTATLNKTFFAVGPFLHAWFTETCEVCGTIEYLDDASETTAVNNWCEFKKLPSHAFLKRFEWFSRFSRCKGFARDHPRKSAWNIQSQQIFPLPIRRAIA